MNEKKYRSAIVAEAQSWLKTPYHHQGKIKGVGVDCAQILIEVYASVGLMQRFDPGYYPPDFMHHQEEQKYLGFVEQYAHKVQRPKAGDIALFQFGRCLSHSGIVIEWPTIIHAYSTEGMVCYGDASQPMLAKRLRGFWSMFKPEAEKGGVA